MVRQAKINGELTTRQGVDEQVSYWVDTTPWGGAPASPNVVAKDITGDYADVSATVLLGSPAVNGAIITLPILKSLTMGHQYRVEVKWTTGSSVLECFLVVNGEM